MDSPRSETVTAIGERAQAEAFAGALQRVLELATALVGAEKGCIYLFGRGDANLHLVAQIGFSADLPEALRTVEGQSFLQGVCALQTVPLLSSERQPLGLLLTCGSRPRSPSAREDALLELCARQAELVVESNRGQHASRRNEVGLRLALNAGEMGCFEWNIRTGEIWWSDNLEEHTGCPPGRSGEVSSRSGPSSTPTIASVCWRQSAAASRTDPATKRNSQRQPRRQPALADGQGESVGRRTWPVVTNARHLHGYHAAQARGGDDPGGRPPQRRVPGDDLHEIRNPLAAIMTHRCCSSTWPAPTQRCPGRAL